MEIALRQQRRQRQQEQATRTSSGIIHARMAAGHDLLLLSPSSFPSKKVISLLSFTLCSCRPSCASLRFLHFP